MSPTSEALRYLLALFLIMTALVIPGLVAFPCFLVVIAAPSLITVWAALQLSLAAFFGAVAMGVYSFKVVGLE